jgi:cell division protein ZapA
LISDYSKIKNKEQSVKASIESFNTKDNNINNNNDIIKEYEIKNKEQNKILQNKEKEIEKLSKEIIDKSTKIETLEKELKSKEDKIKTEKEISNLKDEKLNSEKTQNKQMNEEISDLKNKNKNIEMELQEAKDSINNLEKINNQLNEIQTQQKKIIDDLNTKSKLDLNKYNQLNKELDRYKLNDNESISLRNENMKLKQQITQCNSNLVTISNTNESIIHEKDKIITNLSNNIKELNKQIDLLNNEISNHGNNLSKSTILTEEISALRKANDSNQQKIIELQKENRQLKNRMAEIKTNYVSHDEDFNNIKILLTELNNKTDLNLKKIRENEKKFDKYSSGTGSGINEQEEIKLKNNNTDNITNEDKNKTITDCIKEIDNNIKDYKLLLDGIKNNNNSLSQINKSIIETN